MCEAKGNVLLCIPDSQKKFQGFQEVEVALLLGQNLSHIQILPVHPLEEICQEIFHPWMDTFEDIHKGHKTQMVLVVEPLAADKAGHFAQAALELPADKISSWQVSQD